MGLHSIPKSPPSSSRRICPGLKQGQG